MLVVGAIEVQDGGIGPDRIRLSQMPDYSAASLHAFRAANLAPGTTANESPVRDLAGGAFIQQQRNAVLVGGTGTGKSHLAVAIAAAASPPVPEGALHRRRLVNRLEAEARAGRQGPVRGPATLPPEQPPLHAHLDPGHHQPDLCRLALRLRRRQDDCSTGSPLLRHHRDRQRKLARQEARLITLPGPRPAARPRGPTGTPAHRSVRLVAVTPRCAGLLWTPWTARRPGSTLHADPGSNFSAD
jgi:hypothetical protein